VAKTKQCDKCGRPLDSEGYCRAGCESRFERKDRQYARRVKSGQWPGDTCKDCAGGACCKRTWHHSGDLCAHCGLDERGGA